MKGKVFGQQWVCSARGPWKAFDGHGSIEPCMVSAASYGSLLMGAGSETSFSLSQDASLGNGSRSWMGAPPPACRSTPGSRLTGGLGSGQLSPESIKDLRASLADNSFQ